MVVLPSSPVWYQSRGIDTSRCGILAFASRTLIFLIDLTKQRPEIYGILKGHSEKVTSCSFSSASKQKSMLLLATGADDSSVKIWNADQKLCLQEHMSHGTNKIVSVHWSAVDPSLVVSGDDKGFVVCWFTDTNVIERYCPDGTSQMQLCCLTCSPHQANLVAVGYKSGAVSVMDITKNGMVIRKMRGHSSEVHAIVWSPHKDDVPFSDLSEESLSDYQEKREPFGLLATGSKDRTIRMWNVSKGKCLKVFKLPNRQYKGRRSSEDVARIYVTLYWPLGFKDRFLSSGFNGDIIIWNLNPMEENDFEILAAGAHDSGHQRIIFNMCQGSNVSNTLVTTSMDRQILHWTIPEAKSDTVCTGPDWSLPTLGGFVYAVAVSPKEPSVVAIGVGDGMIRIWKTKNPRSAYDITTLWQGIKEKVMALSWHPAKTGFLAFGTEDGKVGIYDTLSQRPPVTAETYHLKSVYVLSWGPRCYVKCDAKESEDFSPDKEKFFLFSSGGEGVILQHNPLKMANDAQNIDKIITHSNANHVPGRHSAVEWSYDGSLIAIGNDNGSINIYTAPHLLHIVEIKSHTKIINCIRWKPPKDGVDEDHLQIASGSNNSILHIHDLKKIFLDNEYILGNKLETTISVTKPYRSLVGHLCRLTGLSYNPLNTDQIVSASYDGTAQVWEISTEKPLFNFRGHCGRLLSVVWSSVHGDDNDATKHDTGIIYSGADDYTVHGWFCENQQHNDPYKILPDFAAGTKSKFQAKKRAKKNKQSAPQLPVETNSSFQDRSQSIQDNPSDLLQQKKIELLAAIGAGDMASKGPYTEEKKNYSTKRLSVGTEVTPSKMNGLNDSSFKNFQEPCSPLCNPTIETWRTNHRAEEETTPRKRKRSKSFFQLSINLDNKKKSYQHQDCVKIAQYKTRREAEDLSFLPGDEDNINLGFYTDRSAAFRMMKNESKKMRENDNVEGMSCLRIWTGDVVGTIEEATEKEQLTDQLVAMAPMAGNEFWRKTAYDFAKQLVKEEHYLHAVHYMLACDKVYEAIDVLAENRHYREAVSLARARLCDDDPVLVKTVRLWAKKLKSGGSAELAAKCFASVSDFHSACECLAQRASSGVSTLTDSDVSSLFAAASVAFTTNDVTSGRGYANRAMNTVCLRTWNWCDAHEYLSGFRNLSHFSAILIAHEYITSRLETRTKCVEKLVTMKKSNWNNSMLFCVQGVNKSFPESFVEIWEKPNDSQAIHQEVLNQNMEENMTVPHVLYQVALGLCAAIMTSPLLLPVNVQVNGNVQPDCSNTSSKIDKCNLIQDSWIQHIKHALKISISAEEQVTAKGIDEIFAMACEIISFIKSGSGLGCMKSSDIIKPLRTLCLNEIESKKADITDKLPHTVAVLHQSSARFLLERIHQNDGEEKLFTYLQKQLVE